MAISDFLNKLKVSYTDKLSSIEEETQSLKAQVTEVEEHEASYKAEIEAAKEEGFEAGLAQAGQAGGSDKIYSDAEVNAIIEETKAPLQAQISELQAQVTELQGQIEGHAGQIETAKSEAVAALKADLLAKYHEQQEQETASESSIAELLK